MNKTKQDKKRLGIYNQGAKKRDVWTFEPDLDVVEASAIMLRDAPRGEKTRLINAVVREFLSSKDFNDLMASIAESEAKAASAKAVALRNKSEKLLN